MLELMYHLPMQKRVRDFVSPPKWSRRRNQLEFAREGWLTASWALRKFRACMFTREKQEMKRVPMMPVRDMVIFPQQMTHLSSAAKPAFARWKKRCRRQEDFSFDPA